MWKQRMLNPDLTILPFWILCVESGTQTGSGDSGTDTGSTDDGGTEPDTGAGKDEKEDQAKEFSRALAKRKAEIEAKYADYDELKKKLADYEAKEQAGKSDMDKLAERIATIEKERDELAAREERSKLIASVAKATDTPVDVVAMLTGDTEEDLTKAVESLKSLMKPQKRAAPPAAHPKRTDTVAMSAMDHLRAAFSD
ncbi:capsid assembly scaffolding protein Gp46 family protein [Bifidobacterium pseudolongum]|uniref:Phage capsid and scaffold n=1 Tax=Bifidobacterium pseudolongum subsp. globosum TaxID=1690 RepID=A0A4Q5AVJ6_9BIFI|nr:DUF4355 domain-containing protein [Bifidobacterium pseudolongum]RYQ36636.1 Phage capsid and scaffold [Bifidobacterium pseudolongum subsp. globosum]